MLVNFVVKVGRNDKKAYFSGYPYQAIQVWTAKHYPSLPFFVTPAFLAALRAASLKLGVEWIKKRSSTHRPFRLLKLIAHEMRR